MNDEPDNRADYFVLEYSPSQKAWRIEHIEELIAGNLMTYLDRSKSTDYMLMGIGHTREVLLHFQEEIINSYRKIHPEEEDEPEFTVGRKSLKELIKQFLGSS